MNESLESRRPIKSRGLPVFQSAAAWLARTPVTPNMISVSSIVFAGAASASMAATSCFEDSVMERVLWLLAAILVQGRLIANLLDGMVAVEGGKASPVGDLYNEVPDRISDSLIFVGAGLAVSGSLTWGLVAAAIAVFVAYVRAIGASVGAGQVFAGPMAKPHRMALVTGVCILMAVAPKSWHAYRFSSDIGIVGLALVCISIGGILTSIRRLKIISMRMRERTGGEDTT